MDKEEDTVDFVSLQDIAIQRVRFLQQTTSGISDLDLDDKEVEGLWLIIDEVTRNF
ncbi:MAG: hypothetical protein ACI9NY_000758 [Kiritimatiellia bacterium]|jgi:hypothetical protein